MDVKKNYRDVKNGCNSRHKLGWGKGIGFENFKVTVIGF